MKAQRRSTLVSILARSVVVAMMPMVAAAQDPVNKPVNTTTGAGDRLPAPRNVTSVQMPDGRIRVTWSPVPGATAYAIIRSVPPDPQRPVTPNVTDTVFFDSNVTAGKTYYYVISGVNDGAMGMKVGAPSLRATRSFDLSGAHLTPTNVVARYDSATNRVYLSWAGPSDATFIVYRAGVEVGRDNTPPGEFFMTAPAAGTRIQLHVRAQDRFGNVSPPAASNELVIPSTAVGSTDSSSGGPTAPSGPISATGPAGTIAVTIGSAITLRVGATASAGSALGGASASRWVSLDEGIASVDGSGTVSARASGRARLLAISGAADGSVRVILVQVTVTP